METNKERQQEIKNILNLFNRANQNEKFKIRDIDKDFVQELLMKQYGYKVMKRSGNVARIEKDDLESCVSWMTDDTFKPSLMLYGGTGTGKTTFMSCMYEIFKSIYKYDTYYSFEYCKASELGSIMKNDIEEFHKLKNATVLFIDDLGFTGESELVNDYGVKRKPIVEILDYRYDRIRATCCTSNLDIDEIKYNYGEKIYSRMMEQFAFIPIVGVDHRIKKDK